MNKQKLTALCLAALLLAAYYVVNQHSPVKASVHAAVHNITLQSQARTTQDTHSVLGSPSISAKFIDNVLCSAKSPACNTGQALYDYGKQYGIDPAYALAFFKHESSYGLYGVAADNKGLGNIRCTPGYQCEHGFRAYSTWQAGYKDWYQLIAWYAADLHKSTVESIVPTYAPFVENDVQGYISAVCSSVSTWQQKSQAA